eukprot:CAMPEP_0172158386 /NCGR_PEP_ID=MMETSP1050-20130122/4342_1 /TAXON_ID=233186 /ORGANISM="Cryptomonas curvata, Strain CCAP979/52" /LENGTH=389 /DNA_ID=CAMNT_0012827769 /DNA_START=120 /DNA_END=1286 /DNA_ORIENTATION=+
MESVKSPIQFPTRPRIRAWYMLCTLGIILIGIAQFFNFAYNEPLLQPELKPRRSLRTDIFRPLHVTGKNNSVGIDRLNKSFATWFPSDHLKSQSTPRVVSIEPLSIISAFAEIGGPNSSDSATPPASQPPPSLPHYEWDGTESTFSPNSTVLQSRVQPEGSESPAQPQQPAALQATPHPADATLPPPPAQNSSRPAIAANGEVPPAADDSGAPGPWSESNPARRIAVVGLYNSGSSALARLLAVLGVHMGTHRNWAAEELSMTKFLGTAWNEPWGLERRFRPEQRVQRLRKWVIREERAARGAPVGFKHPLLSLSAADALAAWGNGTAFVWAHRPLAESIERLHRRGWWRRLPNMTDARAHEVRADLQTKLWRSLRAFFECGPDGGDDP